ncbi:MAG TPA: hypothetical protein VGM44_10300 [Polyangiaceae bacterium]
MGLLAHGMFDNKASAQAVTACESLTNPVYIYGSTASAPVWGPLAVALSGSATSPTIIYSGQGSCTGVAAALGTALTPGTFTYFNGTTGVTGASCTLTATTQHSDIGVSDVFPTTCPGVTADQLTTASVQDFHDFFVQSMNFVVPASDTTAPTTITAAAAYVAVGLGGVGTGIPSDFPWIAKFDTSTPPVSTNFFIRNNKSGTQAMLGKAIGVDASKWIGKDEGGSGAVITAIGGGPAGSLGILVSGDADANTATISKLAFQATGQTCAFYPDSASGTHDKTNVREGRYDVWGPIHAIAKVTGGVPSAAAKSVLDGLAAPTTDIIDAEVKASVTPVCAMHVSRDAEIGPMSSFQPDQACSCYFDKKATGSTTCTACTTAADCTAPATACNYGFCEVM